MIDDISAPLSNNTEDLQQVDCTNVHETKGNCNNPGRIDGDLPFHSGVIVIDIGFKEVHQRHTTTATGMLQTSANATKR